MRAAPAGNADRTPPRLTLVRAVRCAFAYMQLSHHSSHASPSSCAVPLESLLRFNALLTLERGSVRCLLPGWQGHVGPQRGVSAARGGVWRADRPQPALMGSSRECQHSVDSSVCSP